MKKMLRVRGRVQGVFFRESMRQEAVRLGVTGWVRNRKDGSVEALVQGEKILVEALIDWARQGPPRAQVESVEIFDATEDTVYGNFQRLETL
ncbi:MAG: acylphosphatase [Bdellovibrionales bacterium]|nr:acylphosphatase [Bdellovibrionales bacterium]